MYDEWILNAWLMYDEQMMNGWWIMNVWLTNNECMMNE